LFEETRQNVQTVLDARNDLFTTYEQEVIEIDHKSMLNRFKTEYKSFLKIFNSQYRADKKVI